MFQRPKKDLEKILSFEEFIFRNPQQFVPHYDNFWLYFESGEDCDESNREKSSATNPTDETLKPFERDLYEAYKIMRSYGVLDRDLFA